MQLSLVLPTHNSLLLQPWPQDQKLERIKRILETTCGAGNTRWVLKYIQYILAN